jgi:hypothetical protein
VFDVGEYPGPRLRRELALINQSHWVPVFYAIKLGPRCIRCLPTPLRVLVGREPQIKRPSHAGKVSIYADIGRLTAALSSFETEFQQAGSERGGTMSKISRLFLPPTTHTNNPSVLAGLRRLHWKSYSTRWSP